MTTKTARQSLIALLTTCVIVSIAMARGHARTVYSGLTAHEWGTFTSIAGANGQAVEWFPLTGSTDLPSFVDPFRNARFQLGLPGTVSVHISATLEAENKLRVENRSGQPIPNTIFFERRGENVGFRVNGALQNEVLMDPPQLNSTVDSLARELEGILIAQGLYQNEAQAMVQTWRDSWFEEGSRLLYIVPEEFVNTVLPLTIKPAPAQTTRVFVGRLELVTPATESAVEHAFAAHDDATLANYARFF